MTASLMRRYALAIALPYCLLAATTEKPTPRGARKGGLRLLSTFGKEAEYLIPRLRDVPGAQADPIIEQIEESESTREMLSVDDLKGKENDK